MIRWLAFRRSLGSNGALRRLEHDSDNVPEHRNGEQTDLLELADFTEFAHADRQVRERSVTNDVGEVLVVQARDNLEGRRWDTF